MKTRSQSNGNILVPYDIQFFGGRGSTSTSGGASGGMSASDIVSTESLLSYSGKRGEINEVGNVLKEVNDKYGSVLSDVQVATLKGRGKSTMAYYDSEGNLAVNESYFDAKRMNDAYDQTVKTGFHPSRGNRTGMEAVVAHEMGHKIADDIGEKMGVNGFIRVDVASERIVSQAAKNAGYGNKTAKFRAKVSGYGARNNAEAVAEAFSDVFCNGKKASKESRAIVDVIDSYY